MNVLVIGLGKTGLELLKFFDDLECSIYLYSDNEKDYDKVAYDRYDPAVSYDLVVKCPGVPYQHKIVEELMQRGVRVIDEIELSYTYLKGYVLGVTGTNGKSTTTNILYDIMRAHRNRVFLAGNIGIPLISYVKDSKEDDVYVTELSSFQLENIDKFKCKSAIITNITPDHLSRHGSMEEYIKAKKNILKNLNASDILVLNYDDKVLCDSIELDRYHVKYFSVVSEVDGAYLKDGYFYLNNEQLVKQSDTTIVGVHNAMNALAAIIVADNEGVSREVIVDVLKSYKALSHRYEVIGEKQGVRFINDSKATNPESSMPAIASAKRPTILLLGGMEKGSDFTELVKAIGEKIEFTYIYGECKERIKRTFLDLGLEKYEICDNLEQAFEKALSKSKAGYDILLSPACASWDMYPNFEIRGNHFRELYGRI